MTLILTALTQKNVVQVSDRRVVWRASSGKICKKEEGRIKAIVTPGFACSYTGLAGIGDSDTAYWIAIELSDHLQDRDQGITALAQAANQQIGRFDPQSCPLAIVCAGWVGQRRDELEPRAVVISNLVEDRMGTTDAFNVISISLKKERRSLVYSKGQPLSPNELKLVNREVESLCRSGRDSARAIAQVLSECIRSVARSSNRKDYVSEEVLITALPRPDRLKGRLVVGQLVEDYLSVTCVRAGERVERHGGPIVVGDKAVIQTLPPEESPPGAGGIFVGAKIIRKPEIDGSGLSMFILTKPPLGPAWGWPAV